jgi:hypothetical protein
MDSTKNIPLPLRPLKPRNLKGYNHKSNVNHKCNQCLVFLVLVFDVFTSQFFKYIMGTCDVEQFGRNLMNVKYSKTLF